MASYRPNDIDVLKMIQCAQGVVVPGGNTKIQCLYIGHNCTKVHIMGIAPLFGKTVSATHHDLDLFTWSSGFPHYSETYVNLDSNRVILNFEKLEIDKDENVEYVVVYSDQETNTHKVSMQSSNRALRALVKGDYMRWTGDIFVVKEDKKTKSLMDITEDDIPDISVLLAHALVSGDLV